MRIPIVIEPCYASYSIWAEQTMNGLHQEASQKKYELVTIDGKTYTDQPWDDILAGSDRMVILMGTTLTWMPEAIRFFSQHNIGCILISYDPSESTALRGLIRMDYVSAMQQLLYYLVACGRRRIAYYGCNPNASSDTIKRSCFENSSLVTSGRLEATAVFENRASLEECWKRFEPELDRFDAVICANDLVALSLLARLRQAQITVPEQLFITTFGNSALTERIEPSVTSVSLDHEEMGRQAVNLYSYLHRTGQAACVTVRVRSKLTVRQSTAMMKPDTEWQSTVMPELAENAAYDFYADSEIMDLMHLEHILSSCDATDRRLLAGLLAGEKLSLQEDELFLSTSALRYRLRKLIAAGECRDQQELMRLLRLGEALSVRWNE